MAMAFVAEHSAELLVCHSRDGGPANWETTAYTVGHTTTNAPALTWSFGSQGLEGDDGRCVRLSWPTTAATSSTCVPRLTEGRRVQKYPVGQATKTGPSVTTRRAFP